MPALDSSILVAFLEAGDQPVSGDRLAKELGISRVAVWSRLERLRAAGFTFKASTRKGYILTDVPRELNAAWLGAQLRRRGQRHLPHRRRRAGAGGNPRQEAGRHRRQTALCPQRQGAGAGRREFCCKPQAGFDLSFRRA